MFPFRPSRAVTALLEVAEAMLASDAFEHPAGGELPAAERDAEAPRHPHRREAAIERRRRPGPPKRQQACTAPLTRAGRARSADAVRGS